jgi:hypothetical protein
MNRIIMKDIKEGRSTVEIELKIRYHEVNNLNKMITNNIRTIESNNRRIAAILMEIEELKTLRVR